MAIIVAHPNMQPRDVSAFLAHANRVLASFPPATPDPQGDEWRRVEGIEALTLLVEEFGAERVGSWLRNIAAMKGEGR